MTLSLFFISYGRPCDFFPNKTLSMLSCISVAIPVDWIILHWHACGADGLSVGRSVYGHVITNFLGWVIYHIFLLILLRWARLARESSAVKDAHKCVSELEYLSSCFCACNLSAISWVFLACVGVTKRHWTYSWHRKMKPLIDSSFTAWRGIRHFTSMGILRLQPQNHLVWDFICY